MAAEPLPELAAVHWRPRVDERHLRRRAVLWTLTSLAHVVPFTAAAVFLVAERWILAPIALACLAHAVAIPAL